MLGEQILMSNEEKLYLIIGVEDGWIAINPTVWNLYLQVKKEYINGSREN